jgi:uncharacterized membrane protein YdjX (TVP38/TMEM64 family)
MKKVPLFIALSLLVTLVTFYFVIPSFKSFIQEAFDVLTSDNEERIRQWVAQFKLAGPVVLVLLMIAQMFLFVVPNIFIMIVALVSYGPVGGSVISFLGVFASSTTGYMIGRYLGPVTIHKLMNDKTEQKTSDFIKRFGFTAIAITRLSSLSNDSLSIVAGLLKMSYRKYILATLSGTTPLILLLAIYGRNGKILNALIWVTAISIIMLVVYIFIDKQKIKSAAKKH